MIARAAVFLDRDGTIIEDPGYLRDPEGVKLLPGALEGLVRLREAGYRLVLASNQSGVARGLITKAELASVHERFVHELARGGIALDAVRYCEHGPDDGCPCRKPRPGMLLDAATELDVALAGSFMVGDKPSDVAAGRSAGCRTALFGVGEALQDVVADVKAVGWPALVAGILEPRP